LLVGIVLTAGEHAPEQDAELAGGRDDRLAMAAAGAGAVIEGVQRSRLQDHAPGRLDLHPARGGRASFADRSAACRRLAGLAHLRIQPELGSQLAAAQNRPGCPTVAMRVAAKIRFTPGTVISRGISGQASNLLCDQSLDGGDLAVQEFNMADTGVDGLALLDGELQTGQPLAALDPEQIRGHGRQRSREFVGEVLA
jgi:hypothetical protein